MPPRVPAQWQPPGPPQWGPQHQWTGGQPYPQPYPQQPAAPTSSASTILGVISLVLSISGLLIFPLVLGPAGAICGFVAAVVPGNDARGRKLGGIGLVIGFAGTAIVMNMAGLTI